MTPVRTHAALGAMVVAVVGLGAIRDAAAEKLPIRIDSKPSGATLYLDSRDSEPLGTTPYRGALDEGTYTLIVELEGFEASVQTIRVKKRKNNKPLSFTAELEKMRSAILEIRAKNGDVGAEKARILVDGVEQGNVPDKIVVPAGPHQVEVIKEGFKTFEVWVEPTEGDRLPIDVLLEPDGTIKRKNGGKDGGKDGGKRVAGGDGDGGDGADEDDDEGDDDEDDGDDDDGGGDITVGVTPGAAAARGPLVIAGLGLELGARKFSYVDPNAERPYDAGGVPMARLRVELYPLATLVGPALGGIGVAASYAKAAPLDSKTSDGETIATAWAEFDVAGRYQYRFGGKHHVGAEVGFGGQDFDFTVAAGGMTQEDELPEVSYRYLRFGLDGRVGIGSKLAVLASGGYRQVNEIGALATRYQTTTVSSFGAGVGVAYAVTSAIEARLDGSFLRYTHTFTPASSGAFDASKGTDQFLGVALGVAFRY